MKLIIDIDEEEYNTRKNTGYFSDNFKILEAVANGTPIPDNATNGEVIDLIFPYEKTIDEVWWNSPFPEGKCRR